MAKKKRARLRKSKSPRRSAQKANTKLIKILIVSFVILLIGGGGAFVIVGMRGAQTNISNGDSQIADGEYKKAWKSYGRAVRKEPNNLVYIGKLKEALALIVPVTRTEAMQMYDEYVRALVHEARYNPLDINSHLVVAKEMYKSAYLTGRDTDWQKLRSVAQTGLDRISPDDPRRHELLLYRGLASLRIEDASMTDTYDDEANVRFPGEGDFEEVLEKDPGNAMAWASLAHGRMAVYYRLNAEGKTSQAEANQIFANRTMEQALELAGDSFEVSAVLLREFLLQRTVLLQNQIAKPDEVPQSVIDEVTDKILVARKNLMDSYNPLEYFARAGEVSTLLIATDNDGKEFAIEILENTIKLYPEDFGRMFMLAGLLAKVDRADEALSIYNEVLDAPKQTVGLHATELFVIQPMVASALVRLKIEQYFASETDEEKGNCLDEAIEYRDTLDKLVSGNATNQHLLYSDGIIAFAKGNFQVAANKLEESISRNPDIDPSVYRQSAFALAETGAKGLALDRLATVVEKEPSNLQNYLAKARLELELSQPAEAALTLSVLPESLKEREDIQYMLNLIAFQLSGDIQTPISDPVLKIIFEIEKLNKQYKYDESVVLLTDAIEASVSDDWRLFVAMSDTFALQDEREEAIVWIQKAIDISPNPEAITPQLHMLKNNDRVSALISMFEAKDWTEAEKAEEITVSLYQMSMKFMSDANRWSQIGNETEAQNALAIADQAKAESKKYQALAESLGSDLTRIYALVFNQQLASEDFDGARETLELRIASGEIQSKINSSRVSLIMALALQAKSNGKLDVYDMQISKALSLANQSVLDYAISDFVWRTYGRVLVEIGEMQEAINAYGEAYRIAPSNKENIRSFMSALFKDGSESQRLLRTLRDAIKKFPRDKQFNMAWLEVERQFGSSWKVLVHRTNEYVLNPKDSNNALELAFLLVNLDPARDLVRNPDGTEVYSARAWEQLPTNTKETVLSGLRREWDKLINSILTESKDQTDSNIRMATLHASIYRDLGKLERASEIWDEFISSFQDSDKYTFAVISAADFLHKAGRTQQSVTLLNAARDKQSDKYEIDAVLGSLYFSGRLYEEAAEYFKAPVEATHDQVMESRRIEALALAGKFDQAEQALVEFVSTNNAYASAMLKALIQRVKSDQALAQGNIELGRKTLKSYRDALHSAIDADSTNTRPYVQLCQSLLNEYHLTQEKALLEEALDIANEATGAGKETERFALVRADVLQAHGHLSKAVDRLMRFLSDNPTSNLVRQRLIEAHLDSENVDRALATARDGVALNPSDAIWHQSLAELHLRANNDNGEAIKAYLKAIQRAPSVKLLMRIEDITRTDQSLPNQEILEMARGLLSTLHPIAGAIEAKALFNLGRNRDALLAMERTWKILHNAIENGWISPQSTGNWFLDLHELFKDNPEEGEAFVRSLADGPLSQNQLIGLSGYYRAAGDIDKSLEIIDSGLALEETTQGSRAQLLMMLGGFLVEANRYSESEQAFKLLAEESDSALVQNNLAYVIGVYQDRPEEGLKIAKVAAKAAPRNISIIDTVSVMHERLGEYQNAAETLDFLLQLDPSNSTAMSRLALLYAEHLGNPERSLVYALRGRSQSPYSAQVLDALGWAYYRMGKLEKAKDMIQRSLRQEDTMLAYLHLAQIVTEESKFDEALGHIRMAQELAEDEFSLRSVETLKDDIRKKKDQSKDRE